MGVWGAQLPPVVDVAVTVGAISFHLLDAQRVYAQLHVSSVGADVHLDNGDIQCE